MTPPHLQRLFNQCATIKLLIFIAVLFSQGNATIWYMTNCGMSFLFTVIHSSLSEVALYVLLIAIFLVIIYYFIETLPTSPQPCSALCRAPYRVALQVAGFFSMQLQHFGPIGRWASRIGTTVTEFIFTVVQTLLGFLRTAFTNKKVWKKVVYRCTVYISGYLRWCEHSE